MIVNFPEAVERLTYLSSFERLPDGRPCIPDSLLERLRHVTNDEAWHIVSRVNGYQFQFSGDWSVHLHDDRILVGRAVTAAFVPTRPDLHAAVNAEGEERGYVGQHNAWVIELLQPGDVLVVDLFGKVAKGTFIGDNLATRVRARTGTGIVIDGGIRDLIRVERLADFPVFARGVDPTAIADVTLIGVNIPIRIGGATVLPGDAVLGTRAGVTFIPPHLVAEVVESSEDVRERDVWGKQMLAEGRYRASDIDVLKWAPDVEAAYLASRANWRNK